MGGYLKRNWETFPMEQLKRVDKPTTKINEDQIKRVSERQAGFCKAAAGDYGETLQKEFRRFVPKHPLSGAIAWMRDNMRPFRDGDMSQSKAPIQNNPETTARHIKETAYFLRADAVGICELPAYSVYSHQFNFKDMDVGETPLELNHKYAVAILVDQDERTNQASSGSDWISNSMSMMSYATSGFIAITLAEYIRRLGYSAKAHYAPYYDLVLPPILLMAGLGEMSRIGDTVLHPFMGPRFKAAVVTTDLPMIPDKPIDFGLQDFCSQCKKCARKCPSGAISDGEKIMFNGYEKWPVDVKKCTAMRVGNQHGSGCGTCVKVCPWSKPYTPFHRAINWTMRNIKFARKFGIWGDDLLGYGKADNKNKWWFDLEDKNGDGILSIPKK
ncbi:MAG: reductive dehalogenase [Deltaproteobacteria bacterium]|jgi:reductive dehalogenase|nr:reductive dehalogenase [Deltaproteobacteria bacterium]